MKKTIILALMVLAFIPIAYGINAGNDLTFNATAESYGTCTTGSCQDPCAVAADFKDACLINNDADAADQDNYLGNDNSSFDIILNQSYTILAIYMDDAEAYGLVNREPCSFSINYSTDNFTWAETDITYGSWADGTVGGGGGFQTKNWTSPADFTNFTAQYIRFGNVSSGTCGEDTNFRIGEVRVYGVSPAPTEGFTITARDLYENSAISNFTVILKNSTDTYINTTGSGTLNFENVTTGLYNLTMISNQSGGYFNQSYTDVNVSSDFIGRLYQAILYVNVSEIVTGNQITSFTVDAPSQSNSSNSTGWGKLLLKAGSYSIIANTTGYLDGYGSKTVSALSVNFLTINMGKANLTINATDVLTGSKIEEFSINLTSLDNDYSEIKTTTTGVVVFPILNGSFNITFSSQNYTSTTANISVETGNFFPNYTFSLYTLNSINFSFYDEQDGLIVSDRPVYVELVSNISSVDSINLSTSTGVLYTDLVTPSLWLIRFFATGYSERHYYFNVGNDTHNELNLYMINSSLVTDVTVSLIDETNTEVEGAYIKALRYDLDTNAYTVREIYKTNFEGETELNLILNDEFYQFIVEYPFGTIRKITEPTYIFDSTLEMQILLGEEIAQNFYNALGVDWTLDFNNDTNAFSFVFNDPNNVAYRGCLEIYKVTVSGESLVNDSCVEASSGNIVLKIANQTGATFEAKAFVGVNPERYYLGSIMQSYLEDNPIGNIGLLVVAFLTMILGFTAIWSVSVMVMLVPLPTLLGSIAGIIAIPTYAAIALFVVALIIAFMISRYS